MCYLVVERYSVCRCLYYKHNVDMCAAYGQQGHPIQERTVLPWFAPTPIVTAATEMKHIVFGNGLCIMADLSSRALRVR
ncbi:uncharacterized protein K444DRAFT_514103, partial [Hyaloscypha bicolor E]